MHLFLVLAAYAQDGPSGADLVRVGARSVADGDFAAAAKQLTSAISSNKLSSEEISKALYYRGIANRQFGRLAQAVSDINSALWLKGLTSRERARAKLNLGLAYRAAGLQDQAKAALSEAKTLAPNDEEIAEALAGGDVAPDRSSLSSIKSIFRRAREAALGPNTKPDVEPTPKLSEFRTTITHAEPDELQESQAASAPAPPPAKPESVKMAARTSPAEALPQWSTSIAPQSDASAMQASDDGGRPAEELTEEEQSRISRFFSSLWDDDDETENGAPSPAAMDWTKTTRVEEFGAPAAPGVKRSYRVQLSSSRSEQEARDDWRRLSSQYAQLLGAREPLVEKTELGTLGTFYRLQIGPFDEKKVPLQICNDFKRRGLDCFLVAR